jgi:general stress protein 26
MSSLAHAKSEPKEQFFKQLKNNHTVMLGLNDNGHMAPMTAFVDDEGRDRERIYFFTRNDSEMAKGANREAHMVVFGKHDDYHSCVQGRLDEISDTTIRDKFWNPVLAAWYPGGKADPALTILEFSPIKADIWASTSNSLRFGFEIAKANATGETPDVGVRNEIRF